MRQWSALPPKPCTSTIAGPASPATVYRIRWPSHSQNFSSTEASGRRATRAEGGDPAATAATAASPRARRGTGARVPWPLGLAAEVPCAEATARLPPARRAGAAARAGGVAAVAKDIAVDVSRRARGSGASERCPRVSRVASKQRFTSVTSSATWTPDSRRDESARDAGISGAARACPISLGSRRCSRAFEKKFFTAAPSADVRAPPGGALTDTARHGEG